MPERWIKLRIHAKHRKVQRLKCLLECTAEQALSLAIDWFRILDSDASVAKQPHSLAEIDGMIGTTFAFAAACTDKQIAWLKADADGNVRVLHSRKWISERHLSRERVTRHRQRKNVLDKTRVEAEETRVDSLDRKGQGRNASRNGSAGVTIEQEVELIRAADALCIAPNNRRSFVNYAKAIPGGFKVVRRIMNQANAQGLVDEARAKYVFKAVKAEAMNATKTAEGHHVAVSETVAND